MEIFKFDYSVITVCWNVESSIEKTMCSVLAQGGENYEYLVVDGGSTDRTLDLVRQYEPRFQGKMHWISEKDKGIYDAMNKAVQMSSGRYLIFINSDDLLIEGALSRVSAHIAENGDKAQILYGDCIRTYAYNGDEVRKTVPAFRRIDLSILGRGMGISHQSMLTHRKVFDKVGSFNIQYSIGADWDFLIRSVKKNIPLEYMPFPVAIFQTEGVSSKVHLKQRHEIRKNNGLYRNFDMEAVRDVLNIATNLQLLLPSKWYKKLRYMVNKIRIAK